MGVDSNFDEPTKLCFEFRKNKLYPKLRQNGFKLTALDGNMATRMFVSKELKLPQVEFFTGSGHGQFNQFTGNFFDPILEVGNYSPVEVSNKVIHLLSCKKWDLIWWLQCSSRTEIISVLRTAMSGGETHKPSCDWRLLAAAQPMARPWH